jgi:translation initiation factor IF-2
MARKKILEIAKDLGIDARELTDKVKALGYDVRTPSSSLSEEEVAIVTANVRASLEARQEKKLQGGVIRRRRPADAAPTDGSTEASASGEAHASSGEATETVAPAHTPAAEPVEPAPAPVYADAPAPSEPVKAPAPTAPVAVVEAAPAPAYVEVVAHAAPAAAAPAPIAEAAPTPVASTLPEPPAPASAPVVMAPVAAPVVAHAAPVAVATAPAPAASTLPPPVAAPVAATPATAPVPTTLAATGTAPAPGTPGAAGAPGVTRRPRFQAEIISRPETATERRKAEILYRPQPRTGFGAAGPGGASEAARFGGNRPQTAGGMPSMFPPAAPGSPDDNNRRGGRRVVSRADLYDSGDGGGLRAKKRKAALAKKPLRRSDSPQMAAHKRIVKIEGAIAIGDLAHEMGVKAGELIRRLMALGQMATINQKIDTETAALLATDFGFEVQNVEFDETNLIPAIADEESTLLSRPPVVTIMGHVDHGKTSLLDTIRKTRVVETESGGITQHIGAYQVESSRGKLTFLDTPGHEAFTAMRARGAQATDIVVLVVAADDGIMPQTIEAISHAKAAGVPIIVALNKMDKPEANPARVKQELTKHGLLVEEFGGETLAAEVSAKANIGIDNLLEMISLQAEMLELRSNPDRAAEGIVVEAQLDKGKGPIATVLVQQGTLKVGDFIVVGTAAGKVRALVSDRGTRLKEAGPSTPVEVQGLDSVPSAGDMLNAVPDDKTLKTIQDHRAQRAKAKAGLADGMTKAPSLEDVFSRMKAGEMKDLPLVLKADVQGSVEAISESLKKIVNDEVQVKVIHTAVGAITESDIMLASASKAIVLGFHVRPDAQARAAAERESVDVRLYDIIYDLTDDVKKAMAGLLKPVFRDKPIGKAEVREVFSIPKIGTIAGVNVVDGLVRRSANIRLIRANVQIFEGKLASLKRFKDDVREVKQGFECGIQLVNFQDIQVGDVLEVFESEQVEQTIA